MTSISSIVSPRHIERVLPWIGALVLAGGVATFLVVYFGRSDSSPATNQAAVNTPASSEPAAPVVPVPDAARQVAGQFLATAVARKQLSRSYELATPTLRQGMSRKEWLTGNIPVPYYPVTRDGLDDARYTTDYSHPRDIQLEVVVAAPKSKPQPPGRFIVAIVKRGGEWKVDYTGPMNPPGVPKSGVE